MIDAFENDDPRRCAPRRRLRVRALIRASRDDLGGNGRRPRLDHACFEASAKLVDEHYPAGLTPWSKISQIDASRVDDNTAFVAVNRFRLDDLHPYVYVTHDGGRRGNSPSTVCPSNRSTRFAKIRSSNSALCGDRERRICLVRRRCDLAVTAERPAAHVGARHYRAR